jgi:hypothetical protein
MEEVTEAGQNEGQPAAPPPQGDRHDHLADKRKRVGLSDEEAEELGRLKAERAGKGWDSARARRDEDEGPPPLDE